MGKMKPKPESNWNSIKEYIEDINELPRQDILQLIK